VICLNFEHHFAPPMLPTKHAS